MPLIQALKVLVVTYPQKPQKGFKLVVSRATVTSKVCSNLLINDKTYKNYFTGRCFTDLKDVPNTPPPLPQRRSIETEDAAVDYASIAKTPDANIYTPFDYGTTIAVNSVRRDQELV